MDKQLPAFADTRALSRDEAIELQEHVINPRFRPSRPRSIVLTDEAAQELEDLLENPRAFSPTPPRNLPSGLVVKGSR